MKLPVATLLLLLTVTASAQSMYRWIDKAGNTHYSDRPPAANEATQIDERRSTPIGVDPDQSYAMQQAATDNPVTLYTQQDCAPCLTGRNHLGKRGVPYSEKSISTEADIAELKSLLGNDEPLLPLIKVGDKVAKGYLASEWDKLLDAAGYPKVSR